MKVITEIGAAQQLLADGANYTSLPYTAVLARCADPNARGLSPVDGYQVEPSNPTRVATEMGTLLLNSAGEKRSGVVYLPGEATFGTDYNTNGDLMFGMMISHGVVGTLTTPENQRLASTPDQMHWVESERARRGDDNPNIYGVLPGHDRRVALTGGVLGIDPERAYVLDLGIVQQALAPEDTDSARVIEVFGRDNETYEQKAYDKTETLARFGGRAVLLGTRAGVAISGGPNVVQVEPDGTYWQKRARKYVDELWQQVVAN